jgi:ATP-dependent RNA helicase RhlE
VHRIGRTGRAGTSGAAVSLVSHEDRPLLSAIERLMNRRVELKVIPGFEPGQHVPKANGDSPHFSRGRPQQRPQQQRRSYGGQRRAA